MTTTPDATPNVPIPPGAVSADAWDRGGRLFYGATERTIAASGWLREDVRVATGGYQCGDGASDGWHVWAGPVHPDDPLTAAQARQIGEALIAAADELDSLNHTAECSV